MLICINVGWVVLRGRRDQVVSPELNRTLNLNRLDGFIIIFISCCVGGYQMLITLYNLLYNITLSTDLCITNVRGHLDGWMDG